jgi:hypothetical protein
VVRQVGECDVPDVPYRNPMRKTFEDIRAKHPELANYCDYSVANLNDVDPKDVLAKFSPSFMQMQREALTRAMNLVPLLDRAMKRECFIEVLVLTHGLMQIALRLLYVCAWQRTEDRPLTEGEIRPYFQPKSFQGSLLGIVDHCLKVELIEPEHANLLRLMNEARNRAAHGIVAGEMTIEELRPSAERAQYAALGALERFQAWLNNPCKFYWKRDGVPFNSKA